MDARDGSIIRGRVSRGTGSVETDDCRGDVMRRTAPQLLAAAAQVTMRPTPAPVVTAENEEWYLSGEPITFSGSVYFPAGSQVFFNGSEMVRTGEYRGIPLYTKTTIEPFSKVFVPLDGRLMQP